jgi:hypothetical protein
LDLQREHPYRGTVLDCVVLGQQVGRLYGDVRYATVLKNKLDGCLAALLRHGDDAALQDQFLDGDALRVDRVVASQLQAAPALGAGIDAALRHAGS